MARPHRRSGAAEGAGGRVSKHARPGPRSAGGPQAAVVAIGYDVNSITDPAGHRHARDYSHFPNDRAGAVKEHVLVRVVATKRRSLERRSAQYRLAQRAAASTPSPCRLACCTSSHAPHDARRASPDFALVPRGPPADWP
ncbi:MAG: hypothetical protein ACTHQQ_05150, partial [Solirubrobacteraceae bacterium]